MGKEATREEAGELFASGWTDEIAGSWLNWVHRDHAPVFAVSTQKALELTREAAAAAAKAAKWKPPFPGVLQEDLVCPNCEAAAVFVQENSSEDPRPAYCEVCHTPLTVRVEEVFGDVEIVCEHSDCGMPGASCGHPRTT